MAVRTVLRLGDPRLRQPAQHVIDVADPALRQLITDLDDTVAACRRMPQSTLAILVAHSSTPVAR